MGGELGDAVQSGPATGERPPIGWTGMIGEEDLARLGGEAHNYGGVAVVSERESAMTGGRSRFLGCVILESLAEAGPLQGLTPVHVRREEHPGDPDATVWHVQWYYLPEAAVRELAAALAPVMKPNWYAHFFSRRVLIVILPRRVFQAGATDKTTWEPFIAYGETVGVGQHWTRRVPVEAPAYLEELGQEFDLD